MTVTRLIDQAQSLIQLMDEETGALDQRGHVADHATLVIAKERLIGALSAAIARMDRETPGWLEQLSEIERAGLAKAMGRLSQAANANAAVIERQTALSREMLNVVAQEARRASGCGGVNYRSGGDMVRGSAAAPLSVNRAL